MGDNSEKKSTDTGMPSKPKWENPSHPLYLHHADQPGLILVPQPLVEDNYSTWVQSMTMALTVKNKIGFVHKSIKEPIGDDPDELQQWKRCNNLVKNEIHDCIQGSMTVSSYFTKLKSLWDERDALCSIPACSCGTIKEIASYMETQKTMKFLMGLNDSYATVHSNTLLLEPLPTVNKAYSLILRHERQAEVSNGKASAQPEAVVFAVKNSSRESESEERGLRCAKCNRTNHSTKNCRAHLKCTFCGWKGHTFDHCRKRAAALEAEQGSLSKGNQVASCASDKKVTMSDFPFSQEE